MAVEVVDLLEAVEVEQRQRQVPAVAGGPGDLGAELIVEGAVVRKSALLPGAFGADLRPKTALE